MNIIVPYHRISEGETNYIRGHFPFKEQQILKALRLTDKYCPHSTTDIGNRDHYPNISTGLTL